MENIRVQKLHKEYTRWNWQAGKNEPFTEDMTLFTLSTPGSTYALAALESGHLAHVYYGKRTDDEDLSYLLRLGENPYTLKVNSRDTGTFMDTTPFEYPTFGTGDYRESAFALTDENGAAATSLVYRGYEIIEGKPALVQELEDCKVTLPSVKGCPKCASTLAITMEEVRTGAQVVLYYTAFRELDVITRSAVVKNTGDTAFKVTRAMSTAVDLDSDKYDFITLNGSWARERILERSPLHHGKQSIDSMKGESSHQSNPFAALVSHKADEESGEAYGFNLVYSGNFFAQAEVTQHKRTRFVMGMAPFDFSWTVAPGASFTVPEAVMVYSSEGIGKMSRTFHDLYRQHLIRGEYKDKARPVLINNWEATYFNFDTEKLVSIAESASKAGIEMLVMDDGWFGHRNSDDSSLGDWYVNEEKIKGGLKDLVDRVNALGMKFGIWFEPEMISPDSDLYRAHPDWAIQVKGLPLTQSRQQYVLDYSRKEIRDNIWAQMKKILDSANIEYIKWDMNRQITECGSAALPADRRQELWHRYVLGVYDLQERLVSEYPHILLENCSGGGARFDPGMLYFSPQIWTSDDTDAIERLKIQAGTSVCYPASAMGAHVSDCPNHTVGRSTPFSTRGNVAMVGTFGYELDITRISEEDRAQIPGQIAEFKKYNPIVREGDHYRLANIFEDNTFDAWMFVTKDKQKAVFTAVQVLGRPNYHSRLVKLAGLDEKKRYRSSLTNEVHSGAALMNCGVIVDLSGDFKSMVIEFEEVK